MRNGPTRMAAWGPKIHIPLARERSEGGNHRLTIALDIGKWIPSPRPRAKRSAARATIVPPSGALSAVQIENATIAVAMLRLGPNRSASGLRNIFERP